MASQPYGFTGILVLNQGGKNNEKKHPGWNEQKWADLVSYKVAIVLCQEYDPDLVRGKLDEDWITIHQDYLAARGLRRVVESVQLLAHKVLTGPGNCQTPVSTYAFKFKDHVMSATLVATNVHFHHTVAKRGENSPYVVAINEAIGEQMKLHGSHILAGDFNQAFEYVIPSMAAQGPCWAQ